MELNESSYALKPDLFRVEKAPDITMWIAGVNDGLQELATYNPPGPTQPGMLIYLGLVAGGGALF